MSDPEEMRSRYQFPAIAGINGGSQEKDKYRKG
jgi:hypothetical protein